MKNGEKIVLEEKTYGIEAAKKQKCTQKENEPQKSVGLLKTLGSARYWTKSTSKWETYYMNEILKYRETHQKFHQNWWKN